jgi:hypothetical protein
MAAAEFVRLGTSFVFAQYTNDLLLVEAAPFHHSSPFQATNFTSNWLSFRVPDRRVLLSDRRQLTDRHHRSSLAVCPPVIVVLALDVARKIFQSATQQIEVLTEVLDPHPARLGVMAPD